VDSLTARFRKEVFLPYVDLLKAEYRFHPNYNYAKNIWEEKLTQDELVNGPFLEKSQIYESGIPLEDLSLQQKTRETIHNKLDGRPLWKHQTDALQMLLNGENVVIATGTSSGKTLCYQIPILDDLINNPSDGLRAIIIYPLNALVNDQLEEWEQMLKNNSQITFARFTGQTPYSQINYEDRLKESIQERLADQGLTQQEIHKEVNKKLKEKLDQDIPNRLNHRETIRTNPPNVLITNFSMLEYLLERPIDTPIFNNARLKYLVLDEAHAYRGVQATEIAFLIRRLKDRLGLEKLTCIATSATLGKPNDEVSKNKVRRFASKLFGEEFTKSNPIYGVTSQPKLENPSFKPTPTQYILAAKSLMNDDKNKLSSIFNINISNKSLGLLLHHDENLYRLRNDILKKPVLLSEAAKQIWPDDPQAENGLQALLEIVAAAKVEETHEDLLPTRLHYFVRAQDGLYLCLHKNCPGRIDGKAAFYVSRKVVDEVPEGLCPECFKKDNVSQLVELVTCRKCGYLYGALQDLGPRRASNPENDDTVLKPYFDSFSTDLGWTADSFWSYFCVEDDLPYPSQIRADEEDEQEMGNLFYNPAELIWCVNCGKKREKGIGDNCNCENPHTRNIKIFHRQCPHSVKSSDVENLHSQKKKLLTYCPNCGARNASGLEPVRRFQESNDEIGLAMAIPLSHFSVSQRGPKPRKLLCFTDHRQRAAAFPSLLEEETFTHDMGRKIVNLIYKKNTPIDLKTLGEWLAEISANDDRDFFLPVTRYPDEKPDAKEMLNLWIAETFSYFGIPDSARESAEDLGLLEVEYNLKDNEKNAFHSILDEHQFTLNESTNVLQVLLGYIRHRKAFTLPNGVKPYATAFGRVTADIGYVLTREGRNDTVGWLPRLNKDGSYRDNFITSYLRRLHNLQPQDIYSLGKKIWDFLTSESLLIEIKHKWKLDHERIYICKPTARYVCNRCGIVTAYSVKGCCIRIECMGILKNKPFDENNESIIARWVADKSVPKFTTLKSEEHTAQINKDLAKEIEDQFRAEGVNLLSSTTTFEMGINIGDLEKVLLRNAPPSSASYVQRVGRAGRGKDKNSVCVTLCRRSKYDADAWNDPPRLMSGDVRTPTVFIQNKFIAQRHFNAVIFAKFLRVKIYNEKALGEPKQKIRLEAFLPLESRKDIPDDWFLIKPTNLFLDFINWINQQDEKDIFNTEIGRTLIEALTDFNLAKENTKIRYELVFEAITQELKALIEERNKIFKKGGQTSDIDRSVKNLINNDIISVLAKRDFLPRYAFPLDVVNLVTTKTRWSGDSDVELSRDRGIAIAEFAPGSQVIAHKKVFTSSGLYVVSRADRPIRKWYSKCPSCEQIRTSPTQNELFRNCTICQNRISHQSIKPFVEPGAFSIRMENDNLGGSRHRRSTLIRQRQTLTHFIDSVAKDDFKLVGLFQLALKKDGNLFRYNLGPGNKGFILCQSCGWSVPQHGFKAGKMQKHKKLRGLSSSNDCPDNPWPKPIAFGHQFQSFCLIVRPTINPIPVESLAFSLQRGLCLTLEIEPSDIGVSWRWRTKRGSETSAEIILYDRAPGGSGFVNEGYENWQLVVNMAQEICESCICEDACYDCLKSYTNQSYHEMLDRRKIIAFLRDN